MKLFHSLLLISAATALAADDPGGWSKAKWGMSDEEVIRAFDAGQVTQLAKPDPGNHARIQIESFTVSGVAFHVYFAPGKDDRLGSVLFMPRSATDGNDQVFQTLETMLVEKYGRPWKSDEDAATTQMQWTFPTTLLTLTREKLPGTNIRAIILIYKMRVPSDNPF